MAKIVLFSQKMSLQALGLAQALQFHRHEVTFVTSAQEDVPDNLNFQVLTYFKKWSALEALKIFPRLLAYSPEIWHFVFADTEIEKPTRAHWVLSQLARALPGRVLAASFYDSLFQMPRRKALPLLKNCDIVTTATRENLMFLKRKSWLNRFCETEVLPPFVSNSVIQEGSELDPDLKQLTQAASPYLVVASENLSNADWEPILGKVSLIVFGPRPEKSYSGVFYIGSDLSEGQMLEILRSSLGLLAAFDDYSIIELLNFHRLCSQSKTAVLANLRQAEALPGFCVHKRNGFLISGISALHQLLQENPKLEIPNPLFVSIKTDLADSALNELNRLYSKIRHLKTSSIDFKRSPLP